MNGNKAASAVGQFRHYQRMVGAFLGLAILSSFVEADRRGLLFETDDFAFLAEEAALAVTNGSGEALVPLARGSGRDRPRRDWALGSSLIDSGTPALADTEARPASSAARNIPAGAAAAQGAQVPIFLIGPGSAAAGSSVAFPNVAFPYSPVALIPVSSTDNPGQVVPAVPEPASWLLMIIGVGWLGMMLRRQHPSSLTPRQSRPA